MSRPETGPMKFGDDWTGVFIRGDEALMHFLPALEMAVEHMPKEEFMDMLGRRAVLNLIELLQKADERRGETVQHALPLPDAP